MFGAQSTITKIKLSEKVHFSEQLVNDSKSGLLMQAERDTGVYPFFDCGSEAKGGGLWTTDRPQQDMGTGASRWGRTLHGQSTGLLRTVHDSRTVHYCKVRNCEFACCRKCNAAKTGSVGFLRGIWYQIVNANGRNNCKR